MRRASRIGLVVGAAVAVAGLSKVHAAWIAEPPYDFTASPRLGWSAALIGLLYLSAYAAGLPDLPRSRRAALTASAAAAGAAALGMSLVQLLVGDALLPRFVVFGSALALVPLGLVANRVSARGTTHAAGRDRVLVVAPATEAEALRAELASPLALRPASVVAYVHPDVAALPGRRPVLEAAESSAATVLVLNHIAQQDEQVVAQAAQLHADGVRVRTLSLFYEEWLGKLPVSELERVAMLFDVGELHRARYGRAKRIVDVGTGLAGLVLLATVMPLVAVGNLFGNRGPLLFRQPRIGRSGQEFVILKLRTMVPRHDGQACGEWTQEDDSRITTFGRVLRRTHLDELPQVINIIRGDLSLVGPRPEQPHYVEELSEKLPFYAFRHLVRPGLTGWAQVMYGYAGDEQDALEKLQYEFFYLRRQGTSLDLRVAGRTVRSVFGSQGRGR